ncbi:hypothetical protein SPRG_19574 [Saprolegnia parasitica CBS 223.65]|uniref:RRM domain-containing protein n=1 Tax=Saprolegnia parasitica (strain CBS 223.65) TaxID=695850 RepID=A0A067CWX2_SAPPC|nr:hypothetical protein SPRG_19574 [Saprolegnia parasitica CBS 223.65]KDO31046.1 hypothetical protein SPRG_19574 [Saprolegnia parasitica CBS 223.65]|eukprot:XP_012198307.1 hypothetical protein SPRG_19574 [Saprolegnia parasitica CBS 223.65]
MPLYAGEKRADGESHEMKRLRHEENQVASRVVFARGLPDDCLESELMALCMPFSSVEKVLMIPDKNQAFVELPDTTAATNLIAFYQAHDAMVRGKKVFFAFSSRGEICPQKGSGKSFKESPRRRSPPRPSRRSPPRQADPRGYQPTPTYETPTNLYLPPGQRNKILMVTISNLEYEVKVDTLHQVFTGYGGVVKIVLFFKGPELKALIEMETIEQAEAALHALNGRDIYTGCNTLHIGISNHATLTVRFNNDTCRDYTNPTLPAGPANPAPEPWMLDEPIPPARTEFVAPASLPPPMARGRDRRSRSRSRDRRPETRRPLDRRDLSPRAPSPRRFDSRAPSLRRLDSRAPPPRDFDPRSRDTSLLAMARRTIRGSCRGISSLGHASSMAGHASCESMSRGRLESWGCGGSTSLGRASSTLGLCGTSNCVGTPTTCAVATWIRGGLHHATMTPAAGTWILDTAIWILDTAIWILEAGTWIPAAGTWIPAAGTWIPAAGTWILEAAIWTLEAAIWTLEAGSRTLEAATSNFEAATRIFEAETWILEVATLERPSSSRSASSFDPRSVVREVDERLPPRHSGGRGPPPRPPPSKGRDFPPRDGRFEAPSSCVLICSNIDDHYMKMPALFTIFGCFGDVMRLKIMYRKQGTILVQFVNEVHAQSAREHLDGLHVCSKKWRVDYSKHASVVMPRADAEPFELQNTIDFSKALSHRYRRRSLAEVAPPSPMLHISGIPDSMQPATLAGPHPIADLCSEHGILRQFHPILKQPKMALLEMQSLEDALDTMVALDNVLFPDGRIRVSFSKSPPRQ